MCPKKPWPLALVLSSVAACSGSNPPVAPPRTPSVVTSAEPGPLPAETAAERPAPGAPLQATPSAPPRCSPGDWSARALAPPLRPGKTATASRRDQQGAAESVVEPECTDAPGGATSGSRATAVIDGVEIRLTSASPAGTSGRGWTGNQCAFALRLADGAGAEVRLGPEQVPPFNTIRALVRSGSRAWLSVSFNGYTAEFPQGGNRVIAVDLCAGRVVWQSRDSMSNGGLLLLDDGYLIAPYGFTRERRYVFVLDAASGSVVQRLPVIENICPSKSWAPNWRPGERCDAPGQAVGAATAPRVEGGVFLVDTNTGSSAFEFK